MVLPAQFQLGLELTSILNPIGQAVSAVGSLALIDAIKKTGSDLITEVKLANLIGRLRIDPVIEFHFREMVAVSNQSIISRYLDIVLESGSGPTVQEALKNPALFSMVTQLSGLAFAHQAEFLANKIVDAIEKIVKESDGDVGIVPDYISLLGTIQACQQQTAAFRWAFLYEKAEERIQQALDNHLSNDQFRIRSLPTPVLQGLLMWLRSLQNFPEHRMLHLKCDTGISTVVIWCHHILGLSLLIKLQKIELCFGDSPYLLVVEGCDRRNAGVSLMDPLDPQEPLFTLQNDENFAGVSHEHRAEAYGYGAKYLQFSNLSMPEVQRGAQWVIEHSIKTYGISRASEFNARSFSPRYLSEDRLLRAGQFLFALDEVTIPDIDDSADLVEDIPGLRGLLSNYDWFALVALVITFARIHESDLVNCKEMPLALNGPHMFSAELIRRCEELEHPAAFVDLIGSFEILSCLLLGRHTFDEYVKPAVLVSAWGWSVFFDSIDYLDPFDVPANRLRVLPGVPCRRGFRRNRIIDGPQTKLMLPDSRSLKHGKLRVHLAPGVSRAEMGVMLVGHNADAFQVSQNFTYHHAKVRGPPTYTFGFRRMTEWIVRSTRLPHCQCDKPRRDYAPLTSKHSALSARKLAAIDSLLQMNDATVIKCPEPDPAHGSSHLFSDLERVFASKDATRYFFYVSDNPAARWLQLETLYSHCGPGNVAAAAIDYYVGLAGHNTCVECAVRNSELLPPNAVFLL